MWDPTESWTKSHPMKVDRNLCILRVAICYPNKKSGCNCFYHKFKVDEKIDIEILEINNRKINYLRMHGFGWALRL